MDGLTLSKEWMRGGIGRRWEEWEHEGEKELGLVCKIRFFLKENVKVLGKFMSRGKLEYMSLEPS